MIRVWLSNEMVIILVEKAPLIVWAQMDGSDWHAMTWLLRGCTTRHDRPQQQQQPTRRGMSAWNSPIIKWQNVFKWKSDGKQCQQFEKEKLSEKCSRFLAFKWNFSNKLASTGEMCLRWWSSELYLYIPLGLAGWLCPAAAAASMMPCCVRTITSRRRRARECRQSFRYMAYIQRGPSKPPLNTCSLSVPLFHSTPHHS